MDLSSLRLVSGNEADDDRVQPNDQVEMDGARGPFATGQCLGRQGQRSVQREIGGCFAGARAYGLQQMSLAGTMCAPKPDGRRLRCAQRLYDLRVLAGREALEHRIRAQSYTEGELPHAAARLP